MITSKQAEHYRERLVALLTTLNRDRALLEEEGLRATGGEASGSLSDLPEHLADLATHEFDEEVTLGLLENEQKIFGEVHAALQRIDEGVFGECESCHRPIPQRRLHAVPYARYCTPCKEKLED